jgi:hypothetical protein
MREKISVVYRAMNGDRMVVTDDKNGNRIVVTEGRSVVAANQSFAINFGASVPDTVYLSESLLRSKK